MHEIPSFRVGQISLSYSGLVPSLVPGTSLGSGYTANWSAWDLFIEVGKRYIYIYLYIQVPKISCGLIFARNLFFGLWSKFQGGHRMFDSDNDSHKYNIFIV